MRTSVSGSDSAALATEERRYERYPKGVGFPPSELRSVPSKQYRNALALRLLTEHRRCFELYWRALRRGALLSEK
ncbi:MAG: hypothetical protein PUP91_19080 [Rhizonema sp. PD37]|nr:hypothetical protein [Rhizonema sp. PD37]